MSLSTYFWDGLTTGDATQAPYSSAEFALFLSGLLTAEVSGYGYIIPTGFTAFKTAPSAPAAMSVVSKLGIIWVDGRLYREPSDETLTIAASDPANPRIDRIIIRVNKTAQTIRRAVLTGTPAASPTKPTLTNSATIVEVPLAYIWVAATVTTIVQEEIHDERTFLPNFEEIRQFVHQDNLIINSEHMAFSALSTVPGAIASPQPPDYWEKLGAPTSYTSVTKHGGMSRGRAVRITAAGANDGMQQVISVRGSDFYSIKISLQASAGDVGVIQITTNSAAPNTITRYRRFNAQEDEIIYYFTESDATLLYVKIMCLNATDVVDVGQVLVVRGKEPGAYRQIHETLIFRHPVGDASWNLTAKSSGTTTIDLDADFQALIPDGVRSVVVNITANDSGSAAGTARLTVISMVGGTGTAFGVILDGVANDKQRRTQGQVGLNEGNQFDVLVTATGVGTLDASMTVIGVIT